MSSHLTDNDIVLKPVTDPDEIPELVDLCIRAMEVDGALKWMELYTEHGGREITSNELHAALKDPTYTVFKAVLRSKNGEQHEKTVGFARWVTGYINVEKADPFAPTEASTAASQPWHLKTQYQNDVERRRRLKFGELAVVDMGNSYIGTIRGKKHIYLRHIMVDPNYHRRGIGAKLLKLVTDEADRLNIVCWLYARPAAIALYRKVGFQDVHVTEMNDGDVFRCGPAVGMLRKPQATQSASFKK